MLLSLPFEDQFAIEKTVVWFFKFIDDRAYESMWDLMAPGGFWDRSGERLDDRESFMAAMAIRPAHMVIRHLPINFGVEEWKDGIAEASFDLILYRHIGQVSEPPAPLIGARAITHWKAALERGEGAWKIKSLTFEVLLVRA
ncbi:MAG: hypothetical protein JWO15_1389 [Sphingomonadales bacterium]|jgi:hypothetical protein|nr:hypothetical protein [Sphingomonadales bacterium]